MKKPTLHSPDRLLPESKSTSIRADLARAVLLAVLAALLWCSIYDRWTAESWQTPLTYLSDPQKGDVIAVLAGIRATRDGHTSPLEFTNIPELGAPHTANWDDFPSPERPLFLLMGFLASFAGIFAAGNIAVLLGQVLAAVSFYAACRLLNCSWIWAFAGALLFAFARYAFAHGLHHITILYYWHVPLCLVVCEWIIRENGFKFGERRFLFALFVAFITGVQNIYYTNLFMQLVLFGGLFQWWRRGWQASLPAAAVLGTTALAFLMMILNTVFYQLAHGGNTDAVVRSYHWLEIYGLKIVDLVVPPPDHPFPPFADWGSDHLKDLVLAPGEMPPSGYIGVVGLAVMALLVVVSLRRMVDRSRLPFEAFLILWIILYAGVGGINSVMGSMGFELFRATTRYTIFILCIVLMYGVRRLSTIEGGNKFLLGGLAALVVLAGIWDQTPPFVTADRLNETATQVASDRNFTEKMEERLPPQAMVFQIPIMEFPESPAPGVGSYDHFRPYLYSHSLRFSFGSDKGRPQEMWQKELGQLPFKDAINRIESYGFSALYINRNGFQDRADSLAKALQEMGLQEMIQSEKGDLLCVFLKPAAQPVKPDNY